MQEWIDRGQALLDGFDLEALRAARLLPSDGRFIPVITYPSLTQYGALDPREVVPTRAVAVDEPMAVYVHVPFCFFRCNYCHWDTRVNPPDAQVERFLAAVEREMAQMCQILGVEQIPAIGVQRIR